MESMLEFLRGCLKNANLDTVTKGDMKKNYLEDKGLANFSKDDRKLFSEAIKIALKELTSENQSSNIENELHFKVEDMVTEAVPEDKVNGSNMESDSDVDFAPDNIEKSSSISEPAFKKKSGREILSDSEMSADEQDKGDVVINEEVNIGTSISEKKADSLPSLSENDEASGDTFRMLNKKKSPKIISDDESSLDVPVESKSNRGKRFHSSSSSENDANSSLTENSPLKTTTPKRKKIKVSNDSKEKKSKKFSGAKNTSKDKRKIINSSDSEDEIVSKPKKKKKSTTSNKSRTKSTKKNISDSEEESCASLKKESSVSLSQSEDESNSTIGKIKLGKSFKTVGKQDTSESEDEPLTNFTKQNKLGEEKLGKSVKTVGKQDANESEDEPLTNFTKQNKLGKNKSVKSDSKLDEQDTSESEDKLLTNFTKQNKPSKNNLRKSVKKVDKQDTSESEDEPLANFTDSKEGALSMSKSSQKNSSSNSEDEEPLINLGKKNQKSIKTLKKTPNKKLAEKKEKELSDSDDEPLEEKLNTSGNKKADKSSLENESCRSSDDENEEKSPISKKNSKPTKEEKVSKSVNGKKRSSASENKIENLKKYIRAAGIRVKSYTQLFEKCKSMKAKSEKLLELLEQHGMKGRPTLEKCKKLKKKIETKKEIAELDLSNILKTDGRRSKRSVCSDTTNYEKVEKAGTPVKKFSRLKDIVDSEGSD